MYLYVYSVRYYFEWCFNTFRLFNKKFVVEKKTTQIWLTNNINCNKNKNKKATNFRRMKYKYFSIKSKMTCINSAWNVFGRRLPYLFVIFIIFFLSISLSLPFLLMPIAAVYCFFLLLYTQHVRILFILTV